MLERLLFAIALIALGVVVFWLLRAWQLRRVQPTDPILHGLEPDVPTIVYFTTPGCLPCRTRQQPALQRLRERLGGRLQIVQIDASAQPDVADRWGVQTAPTTFVLRRDGRPAAVNYGVAEEALLLQQINQSGETHAAIG